MIGHLLLATKLIIRVVLFVSKLSYNYAIREIIEADSYIN